MVGTKLDVMGVSNMEVYGVKEKFNLGEKQQMLMKSAWNTIFALSL